MDKAETARLLKLISATWSDFKSTEDMVNAWHWMLKDDDFHLACEAVRILAHTKTDTFAPRIQEVIRAMKQIVCPKLFTSYEEAKAQNTRLYRRAKQIAQGKPKAYNAYGNPKELEYNSFSVSAQDRATREVYHSLISKIENKKVYEIRLLGMGKQACIDANRWDLLDVIEGESKTPLLPQFIEKKELEYA
jgi:hypothetical protein